MLNYIVLSIIVLVMWIDILRNRKRRMKKIVKVTGKILRKNYTPVSQRIFIRKIADKFSAIQPLLGRFYLNKSGFVSFLRNYRESHIAIFCSCTVVIRFYKQSMTRLLLVLQLRTK